MRKTVTMARMLTIRSDQRDSLMLQLHRVTVNTMHVRSELAHLSRLRSLTGAPAPRHKQPKNNSKHHQ
jgi:hypothetical protein